MRVMVVGLGSMGKRRIRLMQQLDASIEIVGVDSRKDRRDEVMSLFGIETYHNMDEAITCKSHVAFVCTSPSSHGDIISQCLEARMHVFTEINLIADKYDENIKLAKKNERVLFLSSTFLYREEIKKIKELIRDRSDSMSYSYHVGQYLPDWHPWEDYTSFFVGDVRTNACRELFAIELPWIQDIFGEVESVQVQKKKSTRLNISYPDTYMVILKHKAGACGTINVDVVSRKPVRNLEVYGEDIYLTWQGNANSLFVYDYDKKEETQVSCYSNPTQLDNYASFVVENAYMDEIITFFDAVQNGTDVVYGFEEDKNTLQLIDLIEADN